MKRFLAGFTLIELMAAVVISLIILAAIFAVLTSGRRSWQIGTTKAEVQQEARRAMDSMIRELRQASSINQDTFTDGISDDVIVFTTQDGTVVFTIIENQLQRIFAGANTVLANDVADAQFQLFGGDSIYITLTTQRATGLGHLVQVVLNSQVVLRN